MKRFLSFASVIALFAICFTGTAHAEKPLKVFVLFGQSNMQGHAHVRTLPHLLMSAGGKKTYNKIIGPDQQPLTYSNIPITYLSSNKVKTGSLQTGFGADDNKFGPELMFGIAMHESLGEPILIIKAAWGGKSLHTDFRPPGAPPYQFRDDQIEQFKKQGKNVDDILRQKKEASGVYYRLTVQHVKDSLKDLKTIYPGYDSEAGYELAGIVWFQGWNDMVDRGVYPDRDQNEGYRSYAELLGQLIRDLRKDLEAPKLPFVIGVMGAGGPTSKYGPQKKRYQRIHQNFRNAMTAPAALPEFRGNVAIALTENCWDMELDDILTRDAKLRSLFNQHKKDGTLPKLLGTFTDDSSPEKIEEFIEKIGSKNVDSKVLEIMRTREFTPREFQILNTGRSNAEFHYLGSSTIMTQIGDSFAKAMLTLNRSE